MNERLFDAIEVCLAAINTGVDHNACLALFPDLADDLRPILEASLAAREISRIPHPPAMVENRSRARFLTAAELLNTNPNPKFSWAALRRAALVALVVLVVFAISWNGLLVASAKSLPGDVLYPVKRVSERVNLRLVPNIEEKHQYEADFNHRRAEELELLLTLGRMEHVSYEGTVTEISSEHWVVGGFSVFVTADTVFVGEPTIGEFVEVEGQTQPGGWVKAQEIHLRYFQYAGEVEQIEQDFWIISGTRLDLSPSVQLDPGLHIRDRALVLVQSNDDGTLIALAVIGIPEAIHLNDQGTGIIVEGRVERISDTDWVVAGKAIRIDPPTLIAANISVGDSVRVHAIASLGGSLSATRIELLPADQSGPYDQPKQKFLDSGAELFNNKNGGSFYKKQEGSYQDQFEQGDSQDDSIDDQDDDSSGLDYSDDDGDHEQDGDDEQDDDHDEDEDKEHGDNGADDHDSSNENEDDDDH